MRSGRRIVDVSCNRISPVLHHHQALALLESRGHQLEWRRETGGNQATRNDNKVYNIGSFNIVTPPPKMLSEVPFDVVTKPIEVLAGTCLISLSCLKTQQLIILYQSLGKAKARWEHVGVY